MDKVEIKKLILTDLDALLLISRQTFIETFKADNTEENLRKYVDENLTPNKLLGELSNPHSEFYFAIYANKAIGYIKLNHGPAQTDIKDSKSLEIERIYVLREFLGKKVGQVLYDKAFHIAKEAKHTYIWLGVWEKNARAISFYTKNAFVAFHSHVFKLGEDEQKDILMKKELI